MDTYRLLGMGVILLLALSLCYADCPENVAEQSRRCLDHYTSFLEGQDNFFSGIDVENVRYGCTTLSQAGACLRRLRQACPSDRHADIKNALENILNIAELCHYPNFYEVYARHQNCYKSSVRHTRGCFTVYEARAQPLLRQVSNGEKRAINQMCSYAYTLLSCVKSNITRQCGSEAASLSNVLVKSSTRVSDRCSFTDPQATTQRPIRPEVKYETKTERAPKPQATRDGASSSSTTTTFSTLALHICTIILLLFRH